ncbi:MAG: family 78 glycoside hydrolase catalytic domain [Clostridia bacterium]|nr:family 78 glycoside hydrolase catalytic domain [Clostridia bacterium]
MNFHEAFGNAQWIGAEDPKICPIFRKNFNVDSPIDSAELTILGFGGFVFYVNGECVTDRLFLPLTSEFEPRKMPDDQKLSPRAYCYHFDLAPFLKNGKNTLSVLLGSGWYTYPTHSVPAYGEKKLCFSLKLVTADGEEEIVSDESVKYASSFVCHSDFTNGIESHSYTDWSDAFHSPDFDDSEWNNAIPARPLDTEYFFTDCPHDKVIAAHQPILVKDSGDVKVYDAGKNLSGYPVLRSCGAGQITVQFSEEMTDEKDIRETIWFRQKLVFDVTDESRALFPLFTWMGFRYFRVTGPATVENVLETHADIEVSSSFESCDETLNWLYHTYLNTQLNNVHTGVPSDCPQLERRGYTGDGQLACRAAMACLDAEQLYRKWILDISDCQDRISGHVQYTAPYVESGGGPGGWGAAIVIVPYEFWKYYGDDSYAREMYPQMLKYFEFMETHSENLLMKVDMPQNAWCLGEWCTPDAVALPAPFINNYFYVKAMEKAIEIANHLGFTDDIPMLEKRIAERRHITEVAYKNSWDSNFIGCRQGANAFALDMGIGDKRTCQKFIEHYEKNSYYDTGIFGTDVVTRLLFEYGRADIAYKLMTASEPWGFGKWMKDGATTFWEYWYDYRSHNHPMFGAVTAYLFEYILGIKQKADSYGYERIVINPAKIDTLPCAKGHITVKQGRIAVAFETDGNGTRKITVEIPKGVQAELTDANGTQLILEGPAATTILS